MRFIPAKEGDIRTRSFFAWFPVGNYKTGEIRWLERVNVKEEYKRLLSPTRIFEGWMVIKFYDKKI
jgi:hypothetical protein